MEQETKAPVLRCKMRVAKVTHSMDHDGKTEQEEVVLQAVYGREGTKNSEWSKYTPAANFTISINNPNAFGKLSRGQFFFCDFVPAQAEE